MPSAKRLKRTSKTLKKKIHKYVCKNIDICCEADIDRNFAIEQIFTLYNIIPNEMYDAHPEEPLGFINNDLSKFIGYTITMEKNNDKEGIKLQKELDNAMYKNKKLDKTKITELLHNVPLYYLLSLIGYAHYRLSEVQRVNKLYPREQK
jgi:hypothetical protein